MMERPSRQQQRADDSACTSTKFTFEELTRVIVKTSADLCAIGLFDNESFCLSERLASTMTSVPNGGAKREPRWVLLVRGLYFYTTARVILNICLQYMYDFHWYEYERLLESGLRPTATTNGSNYRVNTTANNTHNNTDTADAGNLMLQLLEQRIERDIGRLKFIGAPLIKFHFGVGLLYTYLVWAVFVLYLRPQLYVRYIGPFDVGLLRAVVDWRREQVNCDKLVRHEVDRFCVSNWNFVRSHFHRSSSGRRRRNSGFNLSSELLANYGRTAELLERMAANGSLRPFNRSSAWIKRTSHLMGHFCFLVLVSIGGLLVVLFIYLPQSQLLEMSGIETSPMDLLFLVETLVLVVLDIVSLNFYLTAIAVNVLDQIFTINELNRQIACCIRYNTQTFERTQSLLKLTSTTSNQNDDGTETAREISQGVDEMNSNLLFVLMSYKIFVSQTKSSSNFSTFVTAITVELMLSAPLICLVNAPYLTTSMLYIVVACCLSFFIWGDIWMAPCCHFYSCYMRTYGSLHSLLAHTVAVRYATSRTVNLYDSHTILVLRKELEEPDLLLEQFAIKLLGIHFSFKNLLKIHFWCGILGILGYFIISTGKGGILERTIKFLK